MKKRCKRILAAMLAASMIFANSAPAYATEAEPVVEVVEVENEVVEEEAIVEAPVVVEEETIIEVPVEVEETTEKNTEEIQLQEVATGEKVVETYNASGDLHEVSGEGWSVYNRTDDSGSHYLIVELFDPAKIDMDWLITGIDECKAFMVAEVEGRGAGYDYCRIEVQYNNLAGGNYVPAKLWNALVNYTEKAAAEETDTWFFFLNRYGLDYKYVFENTQKVADNVDIDMNMSANVTGNSATVTFTNTTFNADSVRAFFEITSLKNPEEVADFVAYFGNESVKQELYKTGSTIKLDNYTKYFYDGFEDSGEFIEICDVRIDDVNTLSAGTYEVKPQGSSDGNSGAGDGAAVLYTGTVEESSNGYRELYIRHWEVTNEGGVFDDSTILSALQARIGAGESFEQVIICYPDNPGIVNKNVWNAVKVLMNNEEWSAGFCFSGGDYMDENWFVADMQEASGDVALDATLTLGDEGELGKVYFANTKIPAKYAHIRFESSHWGDGGRADYGDFVAAFGTENLVFDLYNKSVVAEDSSARYEYYSEGPGNDNLTVAVDNIGGLKAKTTYTLEKKTYKGENDAWDDGTTILRITPWGFEECGETFTEEGVVRVLKGLGTTKFDRVEITYPQGSTEVSATVWNTAVEKLTTSENRELMIGLDHNPDEIGYDWNFGLPKKASAPINLVAALKCGNAGEYGTICFEETNKPAERVNVNFYTNSDREEFSKYENAFGTESTMMELVTPSGETVDNTRGYYGYNVNDWENGPFVDMNINFMDIYNLTSGTTYTIAKHVYKGDTGTWDDGQRWININAGAAGKEFLTDEDVKEILENYEQGTFREITIEQNLGNELSANLVNEARKYLEESTEEKASELRIGFWNNTDNVYYQWCITNPGVQQENQSLSLSYTAFADWEPKVKIGSHSLIGDQVWVHINVNKDNNRAYYDWTINSLGAKAKEIVLEGSECPGWFDYDEWSAWLDIRNFEDTDPNAEYKIIPKQYRGDIYEDGDWQMLFLSAYAFENQKLAFADIESIINYHKERGAQFDAIEFEQISTGKNVIDKDVINLARGILKEDSERRMTFIFCRCEEVEPGRWTQNDWNWTLMNPGIATKDINATVTSSIIENKGVTVKLPTNTYNAEEAFVQNTVSEGTELANAYYNALTAHTDLMLLGKSTEIVKDRNVGFYTRGEGENSSVEFFVGSIQNLVAGTEYLICDINYLEEIYVVGNPKDMTAALSNPVDAGTSVTWKVYSPEKTEVTTDGTMNFLSGGGEHFFSAQYKSGGKTVFEFFHAEADLRMTKLAFEKSNYDVEFWPGDEDEFANRGHLNVKYYPSNVGMDPADLIWEIVEGEDVVRFVPREDDGKFDGEIQGLSIGTAKIKVTHPENADLTGTVVVNVVEAADYIPDEAWEEIEWLYAFADLDKTLADIELPENWRWANPKQSLKNYYDAKGGEFEAIYTKDSGKEAKTYLPVNIFKMEAVYARVIGLEEDQVVAMESPVAICTDETITWAFDWKLTETCDCEGMHDGCANSVVIDEIFSEEGRFSIKWSDNLLDIDDSSVLWNGEDWNYDDCRMFKSPTKGNYKFNMSLVDNKTSKTVAKTSWSMKVVEKLVDFDQMIVEQVVGDEWNKGELHFLFPVDEYVKISSVKTSDSKVYALGKPVVAKENVIREIDGVEVECVDTWVTYEEKAPGVVVVTVTAADDAKSTWTDTRDIIEREPKVLHPSVEINKAYVDKAAVVNIQFADNFPYAEDSEGIRVVGEYADKFFYSHSNNRKEGWLCLEDHSLDKGTYKVQLSIPVDRNYDGEEVFDYVTTVKVKVTDKAPTVKIKQTKNVNLFYTNQSEEQLKGAGALTIDIGTLSVSHAPFIYEDENVDEDFELVEVDGEYRLIYAPNDDGKIDKKVDIKIGVSDSVYGFIMLTKAVTIKTENKAPTLVLSTKTDTLYPKQYVDGVEIYLKDKATGEKLSFEEVAVVDKDGENVVLNEGYDWENLDTIADFKMSKNRVYVGRTTEDYTKVGFFMIDHDNAVNSTEKFTLRVWKENWSKPVNVTYTLKIATKAPKLTLGSSKLTLNMNEEVRNSQAVRTTTTLANCSSPFWADVYFVGADAKSKEALNKAITLEYDMNRGEIVARLNVSETDEYQLKKGTYNFKVWADNWVYKTSATLKVTIVDTAPEKCFKLSKKGSIDLLKKDSTSIEFTPKMSNLTGTIVDAWVEGFDSYFFNGWYENGKLIVQANADFTQIFNTKHSYSLTPVFAIESEDGGYYEVRTTAQSVKVTQSKPKVTVNAYNGNTLYTLAGNELPLEFNAVVKNTDIAIQDVKLLNYTDDLHFEFYEETGTGVLSREQAKQITTNGKSWSLKFAVTFVDGAGNEKPVQVTYKVTIK